MRVCQAALQVSTVAVLRCPACGSDDATCGFEPLHVHRCHTCGQTDHIVMPADDDDFYDEDDEGDDDDG